MRERKYVKFRVDMYDGTKFKIIDMNPERDLIHYVWTRFITLAGKVNLEGELYLSKNIPYTIETLAIEFNRGVDQVKLAIDVLIELEMIELTEHNIYNVKNFSKHQTIKSKDKIKCKDKEIVTNNQQVQVNQNSKDQVYDNIDKESNNKISQNKQKILKDDKILNLNITGKDVSNVDTTLQDTIPISLESKINNKKKKKNKSKDNNLNIIDEEVQDDLLGWFSEGDVEKTLAEGEYIVAQWSY